MDRPVESPEQRLERARAGDKEVLGALLESYRNYLHIQARLLVNGPLHVRLEPSDLVDETVLKAHREFGQFLGGGEPELVAWLRGMLVHYVADQVNQRQAHERDPRREELRDAVPEPSSLAVPRALAAPIASPDARAVRQEHAVSLADALLRLPDDYREVFILRNLECISIDEIAARIGRSPNAVRKLWTQALLALKKELEASV